MSQIKPMWNRLEIAAEQHFDYIVEAGADGVFCELEITTIQAQAQALYGLTSDNSTAQRISQSISRGGPNSDYARRQGFKPVAVTG